MQLGCSDTEDQFDIEPSELSVENLIVNDNFKTLIETQTEFVNQFSNVLNDLNEEDNEVLLEEIQKLAHPETNSLKTESFSNLLGFANSVEFETVSSKWSNAINNLNETYPQLKDENNYAKNYTIIRTAIVELQNAEVQINSRTNSSCLEVTK